MICVYTKERHVKKIEKFLNLQKLRYQILTENDELKTHEFELGISYCYPRKITEPILSIPKKGFINFHPGPLPKYKGPNEYENAIKNEETLWGVTAHYMDKNFDSGEIIKIKTIPLNEPPTSVQELGAISHYFLFKLFKEIINKMYVK